MKWWVEQRFGRPSSISCPIGKFRETFRRIPARNRRIGRLDCKKCSMASASRHANSSQVVCFHEVTGPSAAPPTLRNESAAAGRADAERPRVCRQNGPIHATVALTHHTAGRPDGSQEGRTQIIRTTKIWKGRQQASRERDAAAEEGHAQVGQRTQGEKPQAGNRDRSLRGAPERRQGSAQKDGTQEDGRPEVEQPQAQPLTLGFTLCASTARDHARAVVASACRRTPRQRSEVARRQGAARSPAPAGRVAPRRAAPPRASPCRRPPRRIRS